MKEKEKIFTPCSTTRFFLFSREIKYIMEECRWPHLIYTWRELTAPAATAREKEIFWRHITMIWGGMVKNHTREILDSNNNRGYEKCLTPNKDIQH